MHNAFIIFCKETHKGIVLQILYYIITPFPKSNTKYNNSKIL